jgi:hypothetical protein
MMVNIFVCLSFTFLQTVLCLHVLQVWIFPRGLAKLFRI